jgi:butyryl-CoA dehydrogenase
VRFELSEEQALLQKTARDFARNEVLPRAAEIDREHRHPAELVKRMAELGLLGVAVPEAHGGSGMDNVGYAVAMEEVSRACASTGVIMSVNNSLVCDPLNRFGTDEQKRRFLAPLASGTLLGCFALSEPEAGSDAAAQRTVAVKDGGGWVINGVKNWITNGPVADTCVLFAMNDRDKGNKGITAFVLPMKTAGVRCGPPDDKLGIRGSKSCQIFLEDVRLPGDHVLGEVGGGFKVASASRPRRSASPAPRSRTRSTTRCSGGPSARRSPSTRRSSSSWPTWPPSSRRRVS